MHPRLVEFAQTALQDDDVRIYQAAVWGKWAGAVNYEQPLHQDGNHSLLPPRMEPGFWHLESFLYLSDVDEDCAPPRLVPRSQSSVAVRRAGRSTRSSPPRKRGSLLAYRSDVWHRGSDFARPDASRFVLVVAFRPASADWFGYDAFPRLGGSSVWAEFVGRQDARRPGAVRHPATGPRLLERRHGRRHGANASPGLDMAPWQRRGGHPAPVLDVRPDARRTAR